MRGMEKFYYWWQSELEFEFKLTPKKTVHGKWWKEHWQCSQFGKSNSGNSNLGNPLFWKPGCHHDERSHWEQAITSSSSYGLQFLIWLWFSVVALIRSKTQRGGDETLSWFVGCRMVLRFKTVFKVAFLMLWEFSGPETLEFGQSIRKERGRWNGYQWWSVFCWLH